MMVNTKKKYFFNSKSGAEVPLSKKKDLADEGGFISPSDLKLKNKTDF